MQVKRARNLREASSKSSSVYVTASTKYSYKISCDFYLEASGEVTTQ